MNIITVNQAIDGLDSFHNQYIYIEGVFHFEFEDISLNHWPELERRPGFGDSSLWVEISWKAVSYTEEVVSKWNRQRVVVYGRLRKPSAGIGTGHMGCWPGSIFVKQIELLETWQQKV